jgi:hypothetical protein
MGFRGVLLIKPNRQVWNSYATSFHAVGRRADRSAVEESFLVGLGFLYNLLPRSRKERRTAVSTDVRKC